MRPAGSGAPLLLRRTGVLAAQAEIASLGQPARDQTGVAGDELASRLELQGAARLGVGAEGTWNAFTARIDYLYVDEQDDTTEFELSTDDYEDLRIYVGANVTAGFGDLQLFVQGKNLTDDEQRYHTSFIKDFAPQPGRTLEAGLRMTF